MLEIEEEEVVVVVAAGQEEGEVKVVVVVEEEVEVAGIEGAENKSTDASERNDRRVK